MKENQQHHIGLNMPEQRKYYIFLCLVVLLVFGNSLFNGYNFDDNLVTMHHPVTSKGLKSLGTIFTSSYYSNNADISFGYRPITHLSFAIEHQLFGEKAFVSHLINLLIFIGCVVFFFTVVANWFGSDSVVWAFLASLIFAIHPIHTEVVDSIKNRDELLAFLFLILTFYQLNNFISKGKWIHILYAIIFISLGLLSKKSIYPIVFIAPIFLLFLSKLSLKKGVLISLLILTFSGIFACEFEFKNLPILILIPILFLLFLVLFKERDRILVRLSTPFWSLFFEYFILLSSFVLAATAILKEDYLFFVAGSILFFILFAWQSFKPLYLLLYSIQLLAIGYFLHISVLPRIALLVNTFGLVPMLMNRKVQWLGLFSFFLVMLFLVLNKFGLGQLFLAIGVFLVILPAKKNKWLSLVFLGVNLLASFLFFQLSYFHLVLTVVAIYYLLIKDSKLLIGRKFNTELLTLLFIIPIAFFQGTQRTTYKNLIDGLTSTKIIEYEAKSISQSENGAKRNSEGRSLNYVENSLIGNQTIETKVTSGIVTLGEYLRLLTYPKELLFYYGYSRIENSSFSNSKFWFWLLVIIGISVFVLANAAKNKLMLFGWFWMVFCLLLFSNWVELVAGMVGERLAFSASAGFCIFLVGFLRQFKPSLNIRRPGVFEYGILVVVLGLSLRTVARNGNWDSPLVLMEHDVDGDNESAYANHMYALTCMNVLTNQKAQNAVGLSQKAEKALLKSVQIYPSYFNANFDLARLYLMQSNFISAKKYLDICYQLDSSNLFVLEELAKTCFDLNLLDETILYSKKYLVNYPQNENIYEILTYTLFTKKQYPEAITWAEKGLFYYPNSKNLSLLLKDIQKETESTSIEKN
ncbi:MAG: glycosyltransferase family 39 protein [Bacteroidia bacterium]|nr:glycosyltransferase family 39 protein [Bacteroidia bacterium]MCF8427054.1 glycosyltransferase family 39 protein [Bacteroidia bacterium]MCF8446462.1 glycosyltransferase family 39 protein [Bacteroidia bacterium]